MILFIVNKYKEYSLIFIIVLNIELSGNMWSLLHMFRNFIALPTMHYSLITLRVLLQWATKVLRHLVVKFDF